MRPEARAIILRDGRTGDVIRRIEMPGRFVRYCGHDPTRQTYLVESIDQLALRAPTRAYQPRPADLAVAGSALAAMPLPGFRRADADAKVYPVRVHLFDAVTGEQRWEADLAPDSFAATITPAGFSPDGARILCRYTAAVGEVPKSLWDRRPLPVQDRLWVARPDGRVEREIVLHDRLPASIATPTGAAQGAALAHSPDRRHVAVPGPGEVQVWDLADGTLRHTLKGHTGVPLMSIHVAYNADGSRLATRNTDRSGDAVARPQLLVWDTTTGRELISIAVEGRPSGASASIEFADDKILLRGIGGGVRVLDGTPVKE